MIKYMGLGIATIGAPVLGILIVFWILGMLFDWWHWKFDKNCDHTSHPRRITQLREPKDSGGD